MFIPGNVAVSHCLSIRLVPFSVPVLPEQVDAALCFHVINHCEPVMIRAAQLPLHGCQIGGERPEPDSAPTSPDCLII